MASVDPEAFPVGPPPKQGMGTAAKVLIILGCLGLFAILGCCGFFGYIGYKMKDAMTADPAKIRDRTEAMIEIKIPESLSPDQSISMGIVQLTDYAAKGENAFGVLMLGEIHRLLVQQDDVGRQQLEQSMNNHMKQVSTHRIGRGAPTRHDELTVKINGKDTTFDIDEYPARDSRPAMVKVTGFFWGKQGYCGLILEASRNLLTDEQIKEMIRSIK